MCQFCTWWNCRESLVLRIYKHKWTRSRWTWACPDTQALVWKTTPPMDLTQALHHGTTRLPLRVVTLVLPQMREGGVLVITQTWALSKKETKPKEQILRIAWTIRKPNPPLHRKDETKLLPRITRKLNLPLHPKAEIKLLHKAETKLQLATSKQAEKVLRKRMGRQRQSVCLMYKLCDNGNDHCMLLWSLTSDLAVLEPYLTVFNRSLL